MNRLFTFFRESQTARFLVPAGILLTIFGIVMFIINSQNQNYIKVEGVVSKTELVEKEHLDEDGNNVPATYKVYVLEHNLQIYSSKNIFFKLYDL